MHVYRGRLIPRGTIRIDVSAQRARVYFHAPCPIAGRTVAEPDEYLSTPGLGEPGSVEPVPGRLRRGRLSIHTTVGVEEHDEAAAGEPVVTITVDARITARRAVGRLSLQRPETPGLGGDPTLAIPACASGVLHFTAQRHQ